MLKIKQKFKKGAASFYIVAFSTLILLIVATSFAAIIISEIERTSNDDLSQSAYDAALAGIEDAKLAFYSYQNCVAQGGTSTGNCANIIQQIESPNCDMVGLILGRNDGGEVFVKESGNNNNMQQYYTCVKIKTIMDRYDATLSSSTTAKAVKVKFDNVSAEQIKKVRISWYSNENSETNKYANFNNSNGVIFPISSSGVAAPPTISLAVVQTGENFSMEDLNASKGGNTDKGLIYLVPTDGNKNSNANSDFTSSTWDSNKGVNAIDASALVKSNDKTSENLPYTVNCPKNGTGEFACVAEVTLPEPINGPRNNDTFMFVVALPYGKPTTDFALEFYCDNECTTNIIKDESGNVVSQETTSKANLRGVQVEVDSTGRANDLYRRVKVKLEAAGNDGNLLTMGPLELYGGGDSISPFGNSDTGLNKDFTVKCENNFIATSNCPN